MPKALRILILDQEAEDAARVLEQLRDGGYEPEFRRVVSSSEFRDALAAPWDVVVSDLQLFSLLSVPQTLLKAGVDVPVIVVSGNDDEDDLVSVLKAGADDCILFGSLNRLPAAVERAIRDAAGRRARREAETRAQNAEAQFQKLIEEIPALTFVSWADDQGSPAYVSPQLRAMTGYTPGEWLADPGSWANRLHPEDKERVLAEYREGCRTGGPFVSEYRLLDREGRVVWWRSEARVIANGDAGPQFVRGFVVDISEHKRAEDVIRLMAYRDPVTGLANRALLRKRLDQALQDGRSTNEPVALLLVAVERMREITTMFGQENADLLAQEITRRLVGIVGEQEQVARLRGDEFAVLLPGARANLAQHVTSKALRAMEQPVMLEKLPIEVGARAGIAIAPENGDSADLLLRRADLALEAARRSENRSALYSDACEQHDPKQLVLLGELRQALESNQLLLHYQPKVNLKTRSIVGAEALVRWRHPKRGLVPPDQFIGLAEQGGLIKALTRWVLSEALSQCGVWARDRPLVVAVNLSARDLHDPRLVEEIASSLEAKGVASGQLALELTESSLMIDPARAADTLRRLDTSGVKIAIDDFGTGYSSLAYLRKLPFSELKIDKSFVLRLATEQGDAAIVRSTSDLGHNLGMSVVAEGVEDERTLDLLSSFGCDAAQGYFMGRPMPAADLAVWMRESPFAGSA